MPTAKRQFESLPFTSVRFEDTFWLPRLETNRTVTIPHIYQQCKATGRISAFDLNFQRALPAPVVLIFGDSDLAKLIEAASLSLSTHLDPTLESLVDQVADKIIHAQQPDGYLNTHFIVSQLEMRWKNLRDWHEMYCAGHLMEGAVAHYQATGNPKLLEALSRYADHIDETFGREPNKKRGYCGHPEIELALVKLYHATNNSRYLDLAAYFIDERGAQPVPCKNLIQSVLLQKPENPVLSLGRMGSSLSTEFIVRWLGSSSTIFFQPFYRSSTSHDYPTRKKIWKS